MQNKFNLCCDVKLFFTKFFIDIIITTRYIKEKKSMCIFLTAKNSQLIKKALSYYSRCLLDRFIDLSQNKYFNCKNIFNKNKIKYISKNLITLQ